MKPCYFSVVKCPNSLGSLRVSLQSIKAVDPEARVLILYYNTADLATVEWGSYGPAFPLKDASLGSLFGAFREHLEPGEFIVRISPLTLCIQPAVEPVQDLHLAGNSRTKVWLDYYTLKPGMLYKLEVPKFRDETDLPGMVSLVGTVHYHEWSGWLNGFFLDEQQDLTRYRQCRAVEFSTVSHRAAGFMSSLSEYLNQGTPFPWADLLPKPQLPPQGSIDSLTLIVTAHGPYLKFLPEVLAQWDAHIVQPGYKILVLDGCDYQAPEGWRVIRGNFGHPSLARNAGLSQTRTPWVYFWDADNEVPEDLLGHAKERISTAASNVALYYTGRAPVMDPRLCYYIDSGSLWRVEAIRHVGGWPETWLEDWNLGRILLAAGWKHEPLGAGVNRRKHPEQRSLTSTISTKLWSARPVGIVTLFRGRVDLLHRWEQSVLGIDRPSVCGLTVVDDSGDQGFLDELKKTLDRLEPYFERVTLVKGGKRPRLDFAGVHNHVGRLYSLAIPVTPEPLILTWEDDVFPHDEKALYSLAEQVTPGWPSRKVAVCGAAYPSRFSPPHVAVSMVSERWVGLHGDEVRAAQDPISVGLIGGGFSVWNRAALERVPILGYGGAKIGWDGFVCQRLIADDWKVLLHPKVWCDHLTAERPEVRQPFLY